MSPEHVYAPEFASVEVVTGSGQNPGKAGSAIGRTERLVMTSMVMEILGGFMGACCTNLLPSHSI